MARHDIPCVIKAGNNKAGPLLSQIEAAAREYVNSPHIAADYIRHGAAGTRQRHKSDKSSTVQAAHAPSYESPEDATTLISPQGNAASALNPDGTLRTKGCVIAHRRFVPRMKSRTKNINPGPGPAQTYTTKAAIEAMQTFAQKLLPLTQLVEALFHALLPDEHSKYKAAYEAVYDGNDNKVDQAFGIWTSRSLIVNANTNNHLDLEDVCHGWCAIVVLGNFKGGAACFPELGVKIDCLPGSVIFMRSYAVEHYIGSSVGDRYSIVHFTHQSVHDAYLERTGKPLWEFEKMPKWWQKSRGNLKV